MVKNAHEALRKDVRLLGELLGRLLKEHGGVLLYEKVEQVRRLAKEARAGGKPAFSKLQHVLSELPLEQAYLVARAFYHFLALANVAEQHHRVRRRRHYERDAAATPQRGSCADVFARLLSGGMSADTLFHAVSQQRVELVLTAHPTEVSRRTLLRKYNHIELLLSERDRPDLTVAESEAVVRSLAAEILSLWETDELRRRRPTPKDEAIGGLFIVEQTLWDAVPAFVRQIDDTLMSMCGKRLPLDAAPVTFGSWMGGDRDGNPNVTASVTREVCLLSRLIAARLYTQQLEKLRADLAVTRCNAALRARVGDVREPYRVLLTQLRDRMAATAGYLEKSQTGQGDTADSTSGVSLIHRVDDLREPLLLCYQSLVECGLSELANRELLDLIRRLAAFGLSLVRLDIRQESQRHTETLDALTVALGLGSYKSWNEEQRQAFLIAELNSRRPLTPIGFVADPQVEEVLATFRTIAETNRESLGCYVISMAQAPSDVLAVVLLQREARMLDPLPVVPLFETLADLESAGDTLRQLLALETYRERIGGRQQVMIGYSDSAKDAGRLAAAWALYRAQEEIVSVCREAGVAVTLFHGRGGTVGRGGGPTYLAVQSQPPGSVDGTLRVTEQGEMIQAKFSTLGIALRTLELYTTSTLLATVQPPADPKPEWRTKMNDLAAAAAASYREMIRETDGFVEYFRQATPEQELSLLNVGSRPARRSKGGGVESLRAIPWVFSWTQTRLMLPAWLGVERALSETIGMTSDGKLTSGGVLEEIQTMYREWPFFQSTLDLIEMVVAKADLPIADLYDQVLVQPSLQPLGAQLRARLKQMETVLLTITEHDELLQNNPVLKRSIQVRNPYVDPIHVLQMELLRRRRQGVEDDQVNVALSMTINGIAAGMRNTG
ncbi:MAG: phosphoenolpyruvate carboxylase [Myxococcales bacterium]|nr:phosphoenolpyruvate carboxylase [Myxococcales bacterium]